MNTTEQNAHALAEIIACLLKYQARYHDAPHAKKLWERSDKALKAFSSQRDAAHASEPWEPLAAEAAEKLIDRTGVSNKYWLEHNAAIIKSVMEKVTKDLQSECRSLERELSSLAIKSADDFQQLRAAQGSVEFYCNKCGYFGATKEHKGCPYFAVPTRAAHASKPALQMIPWSTAFIEQLADQIMKAIASDAGNNRETIITILAARTSDSAFAHASEEAHRVKAEDTPA